MNKYTKLTAALLGGASALVLGGHAFAQEAADEGVVVTGSRVISNGNNMPTPVTVVTTEQVTATTPSTIADALYKLPVFTTNSAQTRNPGNSSGNSGANTLNLRSIGAERTLVLFNGQRVPSGNVDQLPQMLMQRVDIVTGGASAVYGSDAVAGVVNFIIDENFTGLKINGQYGISRYNDGETYRLGIAGGKNFMNDRLHLMGSLEHYHDPGIFSKLVRQPGRDVYSTQGITAGSTAAAGTAANPYGLVQNTRISNTSFYGKIVSGPATIADSVFKVNGILSPFVHGGRTGSSTIESGGDGAYFYNASFRTMLINTQLYGRADYDLTDSVKVWVQGSYVDGHNKNNHETTEFRSYTLSTANAFLAPQYQALFGSQTTFTFGKMLQEAPAKQPESFLDTYIISGGLEGQVPMFGKEWNWDVSLQTGQEKQHTYNNANIDNEKALAGLDAVVNPANGQVVCRITLLNPAAMPGCVPINLFGPTATTQAMLDWFLVRTDFTRFTQLQEINGGISGSPFDTWAGPVQFALSGAMRKESVQVDSNFQPTDQVNCALLRTTLTGTGAMDPGCRGGTATPRARWQSNVVATAPKASVTVKEAAIEADVPILEQFNINGAARFTDYETSGSVWTWKVGGDLRLTDSLRFRATRSRDIRAPTVSQLFGALAVNPSGITDLHTGVNSIVPVVTRPNANLEPEIANTLTAGIVFRPSFIPNLSMAIDYYRIKIDNAISNVSGNNATVARQCEDSNGTSPLCDLYERPLPFSDRSPANYPTRIFSQPLNIAEFFSEGADFEVNYQTDIGPGRLALRGLMAYQPTQISVNLPGTARLNAAGNAGLPSQRVNLSAKYTQGPFAIDVGQRWHNSTGRSSNKDEVWAIGDVPAFWTTDLNIAYNTQFMGAENQLFFSVQNLWDKEPPPHGNTGGSASVPGLFLATTNGDDIMGRYFTAGFRMRY